MEWVPFYDFFNTKDTEKETQDNGSSSTPYLLGFVLIRSGIGESPELDLLGQLKHRLDNHPRQEEEDHHKPPVWDIVKSLTRSDVGQLCRLVLHHDHVATFFPKWDPVKVERIVDEGMRVQVLIKDVDTKFSSHWVVLRRWKSNRLYVFQSGWSRDFVVRRKLKEGDEIGLCWDSKQSCFLFSVLKRA
ncbi:hypothetical protein AAC387_Pa08g2367 [Persea americana]